MLRVVGYCRVSTEEQASGGTSLDGQEEKIRSYCKTYDLDLVGLEVDPGKSGKDLNRPGVRRAIAALADGRAGGVVIAKLDRLTRSIVDLNTLLKDHFADPAPYKLFSVEDRIDTQSAMGRMFLNLVIAMAQWERETIQERVKEGHLRVRRNGTKPGQVPYGRREAPTERKRGKPLEDDPAELAVLARILADRAAGASLREIAAGLSADGVPTKTGRPAWSASTVQRILTRAARDVARIIPA